MSKELCVVRCVCGQVLMCHVAEVGSFLFIIAYAAPRINALASLLDSTLYCQHESLEWVLKVK
jgi:hypothetical protein